MGSMYDIAKNAAEPDYGPIESIYDGLSSAETLYGSIDNVHEVVTNGLGGTGFGPMGALGLALSGVGLAKSIHSIATDGANGDNVTDGIFNYAGVGAGVASLAGPALATYSAPVLGALAAGGNIGQASNSYAKKRGLAGTGADGKNRNWSEFAGDMGVAGKKLGGDGLLGDVLGVGGTFVGSLAGTTATLATLPFMAGEALVDAVTGPGLLEQLDNRPTTQDMIKNFGRPSTLDMVRRMQGMGATAQQQASSGGRK